MCLNWLRHFVKCHCAWPVYQPPDSSLLFIHNHPAVSYMRDYGRDLCLCVCMCVWFRKVDKGSDQNKAPTRIHPAPRSGPYCVYGVNDDGIYTYTKHTRVQASMSSGVRATEVIVAFASDLRGLGQLEADNAIVQNGKMKQHRDRVRRRKRMRVEMQISSSYSVSLSLTPTGRFKGSVWFTDL